MRQTLILKIGTIVTETAGRIRRWSCWYAEMWSWFQSHCRPYKVLQRNPNSFTLRICKSGVHGDSDASPQYPTTTAWVGLVGTLLTGTVLAWFEPFLENKSPLLGVHWWHLDVSKHHTLDQNKLMLRWMQPHILSMFKCPTLFLLMAPFTWRLTCHIVKNLSLKVSKPSMSIFWCPQTYRCILQIDQDIR